MELGVFLGTSMLGALGSAVEAKLFPGVDPKRETRIADITAWRRESIFGLVVPAGLGVLALLSGNVGYAIAGLGIFSGYFAVKAAV